MFNKKKQPPIKSLIAEGSQIDGNFTFGDGLRVDGAIKGNIYANPELPSILVISETATVVGEINADHIIINGTVTGDVHAKLMLELQPKARIEGNVQYGDIEMAAGARINGKMVKLTTSGT